MVLWQIWIQHFDGLADDLIARPTVRGHAGLVEVEYGAVPVKNADRIGHGVEQRGVAQPFGFGFVDGAVQRGVGAIEQGAGIGVEGGVLTGQVQCGQRLHHVGGRRQRGIGPGVSHGDSVPE